MEYTRYYDLKYIYKLSKTLTVWKQFISTQKTLLRDMQNFTPTKNNNYENY